MSDSAVKWEPSALTFTIALQRNSMQQLRATNTSKDKAFTFKVKTTNPKRYCVRPNVGVVWPNSEAQVTVQLPAVKEYPPDMAKCKDKFQVLTLELLEQEALDLKVMEPDVQRQNLNDLWSKPETTKEASVDKIRCSFARDVNSLSEPIPEEDVTAPYSPNDGFGFPTGGAAERGLEPQTPAPQTPAAPTPTAQTPAVPPPPTSAPSTDFAEALDRSSPPPPPGPAPGKKATPTAVPKAAAADAEATATIAKLRQQLTVSEAAVKAERGRADQALAKAKQVKGGNNGPSWMVVLVMVLAAFGTGLLGGSMATVTPTPAKRSRVKRDEL